VGPTPDSLLLRKVVAPGIEPGTSESVARNSITGPQKRSKRYRIIIIIIIIITEFVVNM
jgi:hypothetical protein